MKTILIGGDSWGCGEWTWFSERNYKVSHKGLEQYLLDDGFSVVNCSQGGSSNRQSIDRVTRRLELDNYDHIVWVQSDPMRDLKYETFNTLFTSYQQVLDCHNRLLNSSYQRLNQLGKKIICVGGCSKLDPDIRNYDNLIPLVGSMIELIMPHIPAPNIWCNDWLYYIDSNANESLFDRLLVDKKIQEQITAEPIMNPCGYHPNRDGHRILFDVVNEFLTQS